MVVRVPLCATVARRLQGTNASLDPSQKRHAVACSVTRSLSAAFRSETGEMVKRGWHTSAWRLKGCDTSETVRLQHPD
jgi:hypothetical protein